MTILYEDDLGPVYLVTPNMNEEQNSVPIPAPAAKPAYVYEFPYEDWWRESRKECSELKEKLANSTALLALAVVELRKLQGGK